MASERVFEQHSGAVAYVTLSAPERKNALSVAMWEALGRRVRDLAQESAVRVIVLQGDGADFCAGAHIGEFAQVRHDGASGMHYHEEVIRPTLQAMLDCDKPLIAAIRGHCVGGGLELAACCDLRLADDTAQFGAPVLHRGFPLAPFEMACVLAAFGQASTTRLLLAGSIVDAYEALRLNLVYQVTNAATLDETLHRLAARVASAAPLAVAQTKQTARRILQMAANLEPRAQDYAILNSADYREGIAAFLDKRAPRFTGA